MSNRKPILFATSSYQSLKDQMMGTGKFKDGLLARTIGKDGPLLEDAPFPDNERYHCLLTEVEDREVVLLGGTIDDRETVELFDIGNLLVDNFASRLKIAIPYFGCSTQEREIIPGEAVKAKYRARLLSAIPRADSRNRVYLVDLHSEGIPYYFEGDTVARHIYAKPLVIDAARVLAHHCQVHTKKTSKKKSQKKVRLITAASEDEIALERFIFASTDAGRAKWIESLVRDMVALKIPVHPAFIIKRRLSGNATQVMDISADVEGMIVLIYDDMIRTGGSLISAADAYLKKGAAAVAAISTHGVLPLDAVKRLEDSGKFMRVIVTDSHPRALELQSDFLHVVSISDLLTTALIKSRPLAASSKKRRRSRKS